MFKNEELNIVLQKEYLILSSNNARPVLATESVRGCYVIMLFHPKRSAILHWDDNTCHLELDRFLREFMRDDILLKDCNVHLVGGWVDNLESNKTGQFLKESFEIRGAKPSLEHFQKKRSIGSLANQGFSMVAVDSRSGEVYTFADWKKTLIVVTDGKYRGEVAPIRRYENLQRATLVHCQQDAFPESGDHIYPRDHFEQLLEEQSTRLCNAAKSNDVEQLIKLIEQGITDVNVSPKAAKGWAPLHFACKLKAYEAAHFLIRHGAKLDLPNHVGRTPWDMIKDEGSFATRRLRVAFQLLEKNVRTAPTALTTYSLFARRHEAQLDPRELETLSTVEALLSSEDGLREIESQLTQP